MLELAEVEKRFPDGTLALANVSLAVPRGQFCVVLGSSGAGKTTLLRLVNGLVAPTRGQVAVDGVPLGPRTLGPIRRRVAMIHQRHELVARLTVLTNVLTGTLAAVPTLPALLGLFPAAYRRKACRLLADVGLEEGHLYRRAATLSGGQQQRAAIARAFMLEPAVVLADEPVASLDVTTGQAILRLIRDTSRRHGATVLCSLHQVELARAFADRIVGLAGGNVVYDGAPDGLGAETLTRIYG